MKTFITLLAAINCSNIAAQIVVGKSNMGFSFAKTEIFNAYKKQNEIIRSTGLFYEMGATIEGDNEKYSAHYAIEFSGLYSSNKDTYITVLSGIRIGEEKKNISFLFGGADNIQTTSYYYKQP